MKTHTKLTSFELYIEMLSYSTKIT